MLEENKEMEAMDYEAILDKKTDELTELLDKRDMKALQKRMEELNEFDVAEFLSEIDDTRMPMVFRLLSKETAAEVFANFEAPEQERIINSITDSELAGIVEELYVDDAVDMMEEMPANVVKRVMRTAKPATRNLINQYLNYPENSAGSIMTSEYVDLKKYMNVKESIARIRRIGEDKETIYVCFVISADRKLEGIVTVKDLLYALMLPSANEAAYMLARHVGGSWEQFVDMMNERAAELGCTGTHFCNPCGLHEDDHYTTAHDLYLIAKEAMKDATFRDIVSTVQHRMAKTNLHEERIILTTNQLIFSSFQPWSYANCLGIKTGHTSQAGNCFVGYAEYGDAKLFSVVLGCSSSSKEYPTVAASFTDTKSLCQWGFENFTSKTLARQGEEVTYTKVKLSTDTNQVILTAKNDLVSLLPRELDVKDLELQSDIPEEVDAPIKAGDTIGSVTYTYDGRDYGTVELVALNDISRSTVLFYADKLSSFFQSIVFKVLLLAAAAFFLLHIFTGLVFGGVRRRRRRRSSRSRYNDSTYQRRHRK